IESGPLGETGVQRTVALSKGWAAFPPETGSLGIPRAEMPQIASEHRGAMVNFLAARGVPHEQVEVAPATLKPTQRSEEHTSELQSLMRISYAVSCLNRKN